MPEFEFIDWLKDQSPRDERVVVPIGDDLAALKWAGEDLLLIGVDQVLDGVHFDSAVHSPRAIGRKVMNRNLSDCAAMACLPVAAVATVALHRGAGEGYARELYAGLRDAADPFSCPIIGGDTASWDGKLVVTVTVLGRSAGVKPITRGGAKVGDFLFVTGPLGGSILGRHMTFSPRIKLARQLVATGRVTAMIDLSDGLSRDLPHICQASGVGAVVDASRVPIHSDAKRLAERSKGTPLHHALHDGEDHELLFTATGSAEIEGAIRIGRVVDGHTVSIDESGTIHPLIPMGWEHAL